MKKKNSLFKVIGCSILLATILSWLLKAKYFDGTTMADYGFYRVGLFDLLEYPFLSAQFFIQIVLFLFVVGGFYGVLSITGVYKNIVEKLAKKFKKKGSLFLLVVSFIMAAMSSFLGYGTLLFVFVPFLAAIILLLGYDRMVAFLTTIVPVIIGYIGSVYDPAIVGQINNNLGTSYDTLIVAKIILFVLSYVAYAFLLIKYSKKVAIKNEKKNKNSDNKEKNEELINEYLGEKGSNKKSLPLVIVLCLLFIVFILGCTKWSEVFNITWFSEAFNNINNFTIKDTDFAIFSYIIGSSMVAFGEWSFIQVAITLLITSMIISLMYKVSFNDYIESFGKGATKMIRSIVLVLLAYVVLIITAYHPFYGTITDAILGLTKKFNIFTCALSTMIGSFFNIEVMYLGQSSLAYSASLFSTESAINMQAIITQGIYGLTMLFAPTSILLILGLDYFDISYSKWLKLAWKLLVILLLIILATVIIVGKI